MLNSISKTLRYNQTRRVSPHSSPKSPSRSKASAPLDTFRESGSTEKPRDIKKMLLWAGLGAAAGVVAATALFPAAGLGALMLLTGGGAITGAAVADGALETAGTRPAREFDPYNIDHQIDPDFIFHPNNPNNPMYFDN